MEQWQRRMGDLIIPLILLVPTLVEACSSIKGRDISNMDKELLGYIDTLFRVENVSVIPGVELSRIGNVSRDDLNECVAGRKSLEVEDYFYKKLDEFANSHSLSVNVPQTARFLKIGTGKSSFLAGFGMGFLAFALKKLLLPVFIGAQLVKSVLIAMFLPSILGSLGKIVGKGLSTFSSVSGASAGLGGGANQHVEDFEFKDTGPYNNEGAESGLSLNVVTTTDSTQEAMNRFGLGNSRVSYYNQHHQHSDNYYLMQPHKKTDYKVFHKIPTSSLLLTTYDPFYSPLLSRLDAVFQQLGLGNTKAHETERCRERLVCMMYANPAKYAPYSNLVSAQLSRELNELRKPASDNPEILRFFRYMKAAKDGQDGEECLAHKGCTWLNSHQTSPAMLTTFNDINKLVQARKLE